METQKSEEIPESPTIEMEKVKLNREWSFWESYGVKNNAEIAYSDSLKEIYTFDNIISFWQFWNKYPGNDTKKIFYNGEYVTYFFKEKYRIIAMNVFAKGIKPEWEDEKNKKGNIFILGYDPKSELDKFLISVTNTWIKLIINLIGEQLPYSDKINGIRFVDKTKLGKVVTFKFEIWVNNSMTKNEIEEFKQYLTNNYCSGTIVKPIQ